MDDESALLRIDAFVDLQLLFDCANREKNDDGDKH